MKFLAQTCAPVLALLLFSTSASQAQDNRQDKKTGGNIVVLTNPDASAAADYWTAERFKAARPLPVPRVSPNVNVKRPRELRRPDEQVQSGEARHPALRSLPPAKRLFTPGVATPGAPRADARKNGNTGVVSPGAVGTFGAHYTSSRVFPLFTDSAAPYSADRAYPYITIGKLFMSVDDVTYYCSAAVIQHRIVVTAGHCVHSGTASGFYSNFVFVPAYRDGVAPLLTWNYRTVVVTSEWANQGDAESANPADYAMIEFDDQPVGGTTRSLGELTGWLGWQTLSLADNHTSKLGYSDNLDSGEKMQIITSAAFRVLEPNNVAYGSDGAFGFSGASWIQNFQELQVDGGTGANNGANRVVGVTSYLYFPLDPKVEAASIPDSRWVNLLLSLCGLRLGNCQ